jgi:ABC-type Zn uptake system ZnuABC Zn-binding protein ZnuA
MPRLHPRTPTSLLVFLLALLLVPACADPPEDPEAGTRPSVVTSIFPLGDLLQHLVGEEATVEVLLPAGASPHTFEVTPRQMQGLRGAGIFVMIGGGLDEWVASLPGASGGDAAVLRLADVIPLLSGDHDHGSGNPHIWLDPILVRDQILPLLQGALEEHLPLAPEGLEERTRALQDSLTVLDQEIRGALDPLENRSFVAAHPAWIYFAERYGLEEVGVVHSHSGMDPSSREMAHLLEVARARGVGCVFIEPQMGDVAVQALASELASPTCVLDPLGGPGLEGRDGYLQLLRFNTRQFIQGLGQDEGQE